MTVLQGMLVLAFPASVALRGSTCTLPSRLSAIAGSFILCAAATVTCRLCAVAYLAGQGGIQWEVSPCGVLALLVAAGRIFGEFCISFQHHATGYAYIAVPRTWCLIALTPS